MKRFVKLLLMALRVLFRPNTSAKVFFYHDIGVVHTSMGTKEEVFWKQMKALQRFRSGAESLVCFDDGFRGVWDFRERFRQEGITPTVFVAVRLVGQPGYLTWDEIRTLQNDYGFTFQCHTWSHQTLVGEMIDESPKEKRTEAWYHRELIESRDEISRQLGRSVEALCFPVGLFNETLVDRCRKAGYRRVYTCLPGDRTETFVQSRNLVQDLDLLGFKLVLRGGLMAFRGRYLRQHCVRDGNEPCQSSI